jgi:hypothetical protein
LNEKLKLDTHGKMGNHLINERKLAELVENEKKLTLEIEAIKNERDQKILEYQKLLDQEKESMKTKMVEIENKAK